MRSFSRRTVVGLSCLFVLGVSVAAAQQALDTFVGTGSIHLDSHGPASLNCHGSAPGIGKYECVGEISFVSDGEGGLHGEGVAVLEAGHGDRIVGVVTCDLDDAGQGDIAFSWRDSVTFSNGHTVATKGRFVTT